MYNGIKVLDVHAHVSVPTGANATLVQLLGSNTARTGTVLKAGKGLPANFRITDEDFRWAAANHVKYIDDRNIDVQVIGPRPLNHMAWMQDHLLESWCREVNEMIYQQCTYYPDRFLGASQLPFVSEYKDTSNVLPELRRCIDEYGFVATYVNPTQVASVKRQECTKTTGIRSMKSAKDATSRSSSMHRTSWTVG